MPIFAEANPIYQPAMRIITGITNSFPAIVTTSFDHQYIDGTIIRLDFAPGYGMQQANQQFGPIIVTGPNTFSIDIDTTFYDPFTVPVTWPLTAQQSQCVPLGEISETLKAATVNVLNANR